MTKSDELFHASTKLIPGGVNSPVRAFGAVGGTPVFMKRAKGAYLWDEDDQRYIDYVGSWGPMILGHNHPEVIDAVKAALDRGLSFGTPTRGELTLAGMIQEIVPSVEMVRLVSSGTEACMSALRLARGATGRNKILKFVGCYHGHADMLLVKAGSGVATFGIPGSPGIPEAATRDTLTLPFNDVAQLKSLFSQNPRELAAVILEPIVGNGGFIRPTMEFLRTLRTLCTEHGTLLIFDEVMTGFRVALGGAQALFGIKPDLTTLGKVIGGGLAIGAYGGRREIMELVAPQGPIYQAGTLSGNPVSVSCGIQTLKLLMKQDYKALHAKARYLVDGLKTECEGCDIPLQVDCEGGMFGFAFSREPVLNFDVMLRSDQARFKSFFHGMLKSGVYLAPSAFEAGFISFAHSEADVEETLNHARRVLAG